MRRKKTRVIAKEICAIVLLIAMFVGSLYNTHYLDRVVQDILSSVHTSEVYAKENKKDKAIEELSEAIRIWKESSDYIYIILGQNYIDPTTDVLYDLLGDLYAKEYEGTLGSYEKVREQLKGLVELEQFSLASLF